MTKLKQNLIYYFILFLPFIDFLTSLGTWKGYSASIGLILKGLLLGYAILYILKNTKHQKIFAFLSIYFVINFIYIFTKNLNIITELTNGIKIFYLPIMILFFSEYKEERMTKKTLAIIFLFYLLLYLIPYPFKMGHNISEIYPNKELYLSFFYIGNELSNVFILLFSITLCYLIESKSYLLKGIFTCLLLLTAILMSTKTFYASILLIIFYNLIVYRTKVIVFFKKNTLKCLIGIMVLLLALVVYIPKMDLTENMKTSLKHYEVNSIKDLLTYQNIDNVIFSSRLSFLENVQEEYKKSNALEKTLGLGREKLDQIKNVEIDIFDIFYSIGMIGFLFYCVFFFYVLMNTQLKGVYKFTFILLIIISCFTGHVLISPFTSTFLALLFLVSKNDKEKNKKDILLVSNMYPSRTYPHYGIFVKNTFDLLEENKYKIDLVVMTKQDGKINKLISYIKMYTISFLKAIFENYDFIYVHFVSHSTIGIFLPYILSKNTKLVINVHGNDIVADTEIDKRNVKVSKFFLKFASIVIAPSNYFRNILIQEYQIPKKKIVVYPSGGVDTNKFKKIDQLEAKKKVGLNPEIKYFGFISRLEKDKGYDILLKAIRELNKKKERNNIKFLIIGSGSEEEIYNKMVEEYKLEDKIEKRSLVSQEELVYIYNALEAFIYPTRRKSESLGLTGLEAMACETLVIGTNKYGPSDYLENNKNSLTFHPEEEKELVKKIEEALKMPEKKKQEITKLARKKSKEYSFENTKDILINVFKTKKK